MATKKKAAPKRRGRPKGSRNRPKQALEDPKTGELLDVDDGPQPLSLFTLAKQWPELANQFAEQLAACVRDCRARPLTTAKRTIAITIDLKPDDGDAVAQAKSKLTLPLARLEPTPLKIGAGNQLLLGFPSNDENLLDDDEQTPVAVGADNDDFWPDDGP